MNFWIILIALLAILSLGITIGYSVKGYIDRNAFKNYMKKFAPTFNVIESKDELPVKGTQYFRARFPDDGSEILIAEEMEYSQIDFPNSYVILFKSNSKTPLRVKGLSLSNSKHYSFPNEDNFVLKNFNSFYLVFKKEDEETLENASLKIESLIS